MQIYSCLYIELLVLEVKLFLLIFLKGHYMFYSKIKLSRCESNNN